MPSAIVLTLPHKEAQAIDVLRILRLAVSKITIEDLVEQEMQAFTAAIFEGEQGQPLLRIATIDEKLDQALDGISIESIDGESVARVSPHPLAGRHSYEDIYRKTSAASKEFRFEFLTPTCFHHADMDVLLPLPRPLFAGLYRRWKHSHTRIALHEEVIDASDHHLQIHSLKIESHPFKEERTTKVGIVGHVTYRVSGAIHRDILHELNALADFAFYASVGQKTLTGMGLVRRLTA